MFLFNIFERFNNLVNLLIFLFICFFVNLKFFIENINLFVVFVVKNCFLGF